MQRKKEKNLLSFFCKFLFILFLINFVFASCSEGQIDINTASLEDLDNIIWVGEATAQKIIDARPFSSVDDLINVSGIGETKLADIKEQGLACVCENEEEEEKEQESEKDKNKRKKPEIIPIEKTKKSLPEIELIKLNNNTKDIKSNNSKLISNQNLLIYGLVAFSIFITGALILKFKQKNEFR